LKLSKNLTLPIYTKTEELLNVITHGIGSIASLIGSFFLICISLQSFNFAFLICSIVYVFTSFVLYASSTIYHLIPYNFEKLKAIFRKFDHCCIFLFIAGSYTPISIFLIKGRTGINILIIVWLAAILGIILNSIDVNRFVKFSLAFYVTIGWSIVFATKPVLINSSFYQILLLIIGGLFYTVGAVIYILGRKIKYMHFIWHLFVLFGSALHYILIYSVYEKEIKFLN
jgi:hemolysin III